MQTILLDQLIIKENTLYFKDAFNTCYVLPNLTSLWHLYQETTNNAIKNHILPILKEDLGTLLVVEIMIDATHEVTLNRLETGEIHKNMKHVHDYYVIPQSHYALAKERYESQQKTSAELTAFENCHFSMFPFGLVILKSALPDYTNPYTSTTELMSLL